MALMIQTLSVTAPVFVMLFVGALLRRLGWIDAAFIDTASSLVFRGTMPVLLFLSLLKADLDAALHPGLLLYFAFATTASFFLAWVWALWRCPQEERGIYVQGAFRGNNGIVGLALAASLYGDYGLSVGGVLASIAILIYNSLSAVILAIYTPGAKTSPKAILKGIARNPLILGVVFSIPFALMQVKLPVWLQTSAESFARMTLPLALICIGGSLSWNAVRHHGHLALACTWLKMFWLPVFGTLLALVFGFRGPDLGILFLYFACPTAAASFVMAKAINSNYELAAAIIVLTTLVSVVTMNLGILLLQWLGLA